MKGVVGGAASSASKITDALDNFVRGAGQLDDTDALSAGTSLEKVRACCVGTFRWRGWLKEVVGGAGERAVPDTYSNLGFAIAAVNSIVRWPWTGSRYFASPASADNCQWLLPRLSG